MTATEHHRAPADDPPAGATGRLPPNDHDAERAVLGAVMQGVDPAELSLQADQFDDPDHEAIWAAACRLRLADKPVTVVTIGDALAADNVHLNVKGGRPYLAGLWEAGLPVDAQAHADIVRRHALDRETLKLSRLIAQDISEGHDPGRHVSALVEIREGGSPVHNRAIAGGEFIFTASETPSAWWGRGTEVLGATGESLVIAGPQGTGKSTIGQQLALGRVGLTDYSELLGYPIAPDPRGVLYLACDRSIQVARSMLRMVPKSARDIVNRRMDVWRGPLPKSLNDDPLALVKLGRTFHRGTIVVDSLKDTTRALKEDDGGSAYNIARQHALAEGFEIIELHHTKKRPTDVRGRPSVDDVYGSTWITSGAGSVLLLDGQPGDPVVKLFHVKQPMDDVGPLTIEHDNRTGRTHVRFGVDLVQAARGRNGITNADAARLLFESDSANDRKKAERRLTVLVNKGLLDKIPGDSATQTASLWVAKDLPGHLPAGGQNGKASRHLPDLPGKHLQVVPDKGK
ncbi:DnaB-like helicase N-terminal domain-containing protein [Acidipropionibacterium jensenii]|nr:DnaB-like helicase N-terminal domain-containing protein [Acidipropionibacterium jensenii]